jgi:hypothetical protein
MRQLIARAFLLSVLTVPGVVACGGKGSAPPAESAATSTTAPASKTLASVSAVRTRVDPYADLVIYLDGAGFRTSPSFRALENALAMVPGASAERAKLTEQCGFDPVQSVEAVAISGMRAGGSLDENSLILAAQFTEPPERVLDCIARLAPKASATELEGRKALESPDGIVIAADGNLLLAGPRTRVTSALSQRPAVAPALANGTYLHVRTNALQAFALDQVTFNMSRVPAGTRLRFVDEAASPEAAARAEGKFRQLRELSKQLFSESVKSQEGQRYAAALLDAAVIERSGTTVSATLDLPSAEGEAAFTSMMSALAIYGVRRYVADAKTTEARSTVGAIAKSLATHAAGKGKMRFPKSAPRTPKDVPAGTKFVADAKTFSHASWKAIGFQREGPQYYSYEYETSRDGKRATVRAHGDLDADGMTSRFELTVEVTAAGEIVIGPELREVEPME